MDFHTPWGKYEIISSTNECKVKKLTIYPQQRTSLQYHNHRVEHWIIVFGTAHVTCGDSNKEKSVPKGSYIKIEEKEIHRIANKTNDKLEVIEVQFGVYLGEDDITRIEDDYGRK